MANRDDLDSRVAIVTGAASGMGRVMARALAAAGANIVAVDVDLGGLKSLAAEPIFAGKCHTALTDVSQAEQCRKAVDDAMRAHGRLDILINSAGVGMVSAAPGKNRAPFFELDPEGCRRIVMINCVGTLLMARFAAPAMVAQGWGRIINVTTSFDTMLAAGLSAYGASKAGVEATTVSFAKDLQGTGVTVNILVPGGPTDTPFFPPGAPKPPGLIDPQVMAVPIVWLASSASDGITACRFVAQDWDVTLTAAKAAAKARSPAVWPSLAESAQAGRGIAI